MKEEITITDEVIDSLMDDWLDRDGDTYVKKRTSKRLGWEKSLDEDASYSSYILESPTQEDLVKRAYTLARETLSVMDMPFKIHLRVLPGNDSYTDGRNVCVSTKVFDEPEYSVGEKLDVFLGITVHEGCHVLYTDFNEIRPIKIPAIHEIFNILEDERIERICGFNFPGLSNFIEKVKFYIFDKYYLDYVVPEKEKRELNPFERIFNLLLYIIRYPKYLEESEVIEFAPYLLKIKEVVLPYPETTSQCVKCAYKVFDIIKEFYKDEMRKHEESKGSGEGDSMSDEELEEAIGEILKKDVERDSHKRKIVSGSPTSAPAKDGGGLGDSDVASVIKDDEGIVGELCEGLAEVGDGKDTFFLKSDSNQAVYMESLSRVKRYIPAINKILKGHCKEYKLIHRSMRSGVLDTNKLAEAFQGIPTCYIREGEVRTDKVSVVVLIDESGSMGGDRIQSARDAAVLINEAIGNIPNVELFIYGHSGDEKRYYSTEMYVYREKNYSPKYALGAVRARFQNRDGVAIYETALRVREQTKNPCLFFILSDGAPCAGDYGGTSAMHHVKEQVIKTEKMGFYVIQVCINHCYDPASMFKNYVILEDMSTLALELAKAIKKSTISAAKVSVT